MPPRTPALSYTGLFVLQALASGYRFGFDVMQATGLAGFIVTAAAHARLRLARMAASAIRSFFVRRPR